MDRDAITKLLRDQLGPLTRALWLYFPLIQLVVFRLVPQPLWPLVFNAIGLVFGVVVNYSTSRSSGSTSDS